MKKKGTLYLCTLIVSITICFLFIPYSYASVCSTKIELNGHWATENIERSIFQRTIICYQSDSYLQILNESADCDIAIQIINCDTGEVVFQQTVLKPATTNILMPIMDLSSGEYILKLNGSGTRHLEGRFTK